MHFATLNQHRANYCGDIGKNNKKPTIFGWFLFYALRTRRDLKPRRVTTLVLGKLDAVVNYTDMKHIY